MISLEKLKQSISESMIATSPSPVVRSDYFDWIKKASENKLIKVITGFRRSGKSYLLKMFSRHLIGQNVPIENIFYLNFENDLLIDVKTVEDLRKVWELYLTKIAKLDSPIYIIWDEVQLVSSWEKLVRTLYEGGKYNIFLSGSNSQLLSSELSSSLSGRSIELNVSPFSFNEYLDYLNIDNTNYYQNKNKIDQAFNKYLRRGGLAEQFELDDNLSTNYKEGLIQKVILDDIAKRYQIDKIKVLQNLFQFISGNVTSTLSLRKIVNRLSGQGIDIALATLDNYIYYWETSYSLSKLTKFDYKLSRVFNRTVKYYIVDNIFISGDEESDKKRLENLVYNELIRRYGRDNVNFGSEANGYEVDFVVKNNDSYLFYQACLVLNEGNIKREIGNLDLVNKYQKGESTLLVLSNELKKNSDSRVKSLVEWLTQR